MAEACEGVAWVHLEAEVGLGVDELGEEGEAVAVARVGLVAEEALLVLVYELREGEALVVLRVDAPCLHGALAVGHSAHFPALAHAGALGKAFERGEACACPERGLAEGRERVGRCHRGLGVGKEESRPACGARTALVLRDLMRALMLTLRPASLRELRSLLRLPEPLPEHLPVAVPRLLPTSCVSGACAWPSSRS